METLAVPGRQRERDLQQGNKSGGKQVVTPRKMCETRKNEINNRNSQTRRNRGDRWFYVFVFAVPAQRAWLFTEINAGRKCQVCKDDPKKKNLKKNQTEKD